MTYTPIPAGTLNWDVLVNAAFTAQDVSITGNTSDIAQLSTRTAALEAGQGPLPSEQGFAGWTFDPSTMGGGSGTAFGVVYTAKIILRTSAVITNVCFYVNSLATTLTAGQNFAGLYDSTGTRLGVTADQSTNWTSIGFKAMPLSGGPILLSPGTYYTSFVSNGTGTFGVGRASNASSAGDGANFGLTASSYRFAFGPTAQTSLPTSIALGSRTVSPLIFWYGLS